MKLVARKNIVKVTNHGISTFISYYLHIFGAQDPSLGPKAAAGRARAGPLPPLWRLGPGPWPQNVKIIANECEKNTTWHFHIIFICISYDFHILELGTQARGPNSYYLHIPGHIISILLCVPGPRAISNRNLWNSLEDTPPHP